MASKTIRVGLLLLVSQTLLALAIIGAALNFFVDQDHAILRWNMQPVPYNASLKANSTELSQRPPHNGLNESSNGTAAIVNSILGQNKTQPASKIQMPKSFNFSRWLTEKGLNESLSGTASTDIRNEINANLSRCQAMQIVRPGIPDKDIIMHFVSESAPNLNLTRIENEKQSDCVPLQDNCAIVGNSGILSGSKCGDVIDSSQYVIRLNLALLGARFQEDVGSQTDVMSMNHQQMRMLASCSGTLSRKKGGFAVSKAKCNDLLTGMNIFKKENRVLWFFKDCTFLNSVKDAMALQREKNDLDFRFAYSPGSPMVAASRFLNLRVPSSGFATYVAATQFCRNISLFGFYPFNSTAERSILNHYYDTKPSSKQTSKKTTKKKVVFSPHDMHLEYQLLTALAGKGALRIINNCDGNLSTT